MLHDGHSLNLSSMSFKNIHLRIEVNGMKKVGQFTLLTPL
jgi:hypothetical protein